MGRGHHPGGYQARLNPILTLVSYEMCQRDFLPVHFRSRNTTAHAHSGTCMRRLIRRDELSRRLSNCRTAAAISASQTARGVVVPHGQPQARYAIAVGCEIKYATRLIYSTGISLERVEPTPIGINCRLRERPNCSQRAAPPLTRTLVLDEAVRSVSPFQFNTGQDE